MEKFNSLEEVKIFTQKLPWQECEMNDLKEKFNTLATYFLYGGSLVSIKKV